MALAVSVIAWGWSPPIAAIEVAPLDFKITRDGSEIGRHTVGFRRDGNQLDVEIAGEVAIKLAFITVYRYQQKRTETWIDGRLVAFNSYTYDDGKEITTKGRVEGNMLRIESDGATTRDVPAGTITANFWNLVTVDQAQLIESTDGKILSVAVTPGEIELVPVGKTAVAARRYEITGDLARELWYDDQGRWVKLALIARDGSKIAFIAR